MSPRLYPKLIRNESRPQLFPLREGGRDSIWPVRHYSDYTIEYVFRNGYSKAITAHLTQQTVTREWLPKFCKKFFIKSDTDLRNTRQRDIRLKTLCEE